MRVFLDVNILMYAIGAPHPFREPSAHLLERVVQGELDAVSDTEILQEILYRFWRLRQVEVAVAVVKQVAQLLPGLWPIETQDSLLAATLLSQYPRLEPRDALHAAVMLNHGLTHLYSYDRHFDLIPGLRRLEP